MSGSTVRKDTLRRIEKERAGWQPLVAEIGEERMTEPGPMGEWSFKDLTSHLTGWRRYSISRLEAVLRGEGDAPFPWPSALTADDEINQWIYDTDKDRPLADVLSGFDATFARLRAVVKEMQDGMLTDSNAFAWMEGESLGTALVSGLHFDHWHEEHEPTARAWLDGSSVR